jgi:hypothetical protein
MTGRCRKLHNELHDLYSSSRINIIMKYRMMKWAGHVSPMGEERDVHRILVGKAERMRSLGRRRWR